MGLPGRLGAAVTRETQGATHATQSTTAQHHLRPGRVRRGRGPDPDHAGSRPGHGTAARAAAGDRPHRTAASPTRKVDQVQKTHEAHYTNAPCNRAQKDYLQKHLARCFSVVRTALDHQISPAADPPPTALGPADIQDAYNLPDSGDGETVGIVDAFGDSHAEADLAQFRSFYGLPPCTVANGCLTIVNQDGDDQPAAPGRPRLGTGDVARPRRGLVRLPEVLRSCSCRATTTPSTTSASPSTPRCRSAPSSSRTPTACPARTRASRTSTTTTTTRASP